MLCYHPCSHDNLVVGCPLCSEERGAVYYYSNINGVLDAPVKIPAPNENQKGRFGISVESIGDLDRDGYNGKKHITNVTMDYRLVVDVAIAAPLEVGQHDDGTYYTGVVYIFRSDSATSILTDYSQVRLCNVEHNISEVEDMLFAAIWANKTVCWLMSH